MIDTALYIQMRVAREDHLLSSMQEAVQKQKELTTALDEMEARHVEERDKASKIEVCIIAR